MTDASGNSVTGAISTVQAGGSVQCPSAFDTAPSTPWSTDTLTADCDGTYTLCYTIKAGDGSNPQPTDCTVISVCAGPMQATANVAVAFPELPGWLADASASACIQQLEDSGGYGVMSVSGTASCGPVQRDFNTVTYCPTNCFGPNPSPSCSTCVAGGGGPF